MNYEEANRYISSSCIFQGEMNMMANSIDLLLGFIFELKKIESTAMLGPKIEVFKKNGNVWSQKYTGDLKKLVQKLKAFNKNWIITKHGTIVLGKPNLTFRKDDKFFEFSQSHQEEIKHEFSLIMRELTQIHNVFLP
jgi:hypothetical protein